jgi:ATP-dependent DNA helicase RecG
MAQQRRAQAGDGAPVRVLPAAGPLRLDSPVERLPRVTATEVKLLRRLGLETVRDLLLHLPFGWDSFGGPTAVAQLPPGQQATVIVTVTSIQAKTMRFKKKRLAEASVVDEHGGRLKVTWFNQPYLAERIRPGDRLALAGVVSRSKYPPYLEMRNPHHEPVEEGEGPRRVGGLMPKYHLAGALTSRRIATWVEAALPLADGLEDDVPEPTRRRHGLFPLAQVVRDAHRPAVEADWERALGRMEFAALLELQAAFLLGRRRIAQERATPVPYEQDVIDRFKAGLGFVLTNAQRRAAWDVYRDMARPVPMNRLLDGDVGSGKTAVAAAAAAMTHAAGLQTVLMAPTEILARQHRDKLRAYLEDTFPDLRVELLVSGLPAAERRRVRTAAASGHCALLVGTHALIEDEVELADLGLAVVDEQHRFGTRQRELLRDKSHRGRPHFLAMTATPIPRTLALALYGEMELSIMDELPPGRTPIETHVVAPDARESAYELVRSEVGAGRQVFVICPLIDESVHLEARAVTAEFERLRTEVFPDLRLALVHGRMKDKDTVMRGFRAGESDVLVATSVIEVGVDVPNATVMLIEGAERFGLAQLHQLRGRVGRGTLRSYCMLLSDDPSIAMLRRLDLVAGTSDGFLLAQADMHQRDVGELMGSRQHGQSDHAMRGLSRPELLSEVRQEAEALLADDPDLTRWPRLWDAALRRLDQTSIS